MDPDIRAHRIRFAPLLFAWRKGIREAARAPFRRSRTRVHRGRRSRSRCLVRAALPVLRITDRSSNATAKDFASDYPEYHASRDDGPDSVPNGIPDSVPDRFTISISDSIAVKASQHFSTLPASPGGSSALQLSYAQALADWLTRRRSRRAEMLRGAQRRANLQDGAVSEEVVS